MCRLWSVEEQNNCGAGSEPVYPGAHHPHMPSPEHSKHTCGLFAMYVVSI